MTSPQTPAPSLTYARQWRGALTLPRWVRVVIALLALPQMVAPWLPLQADLSAWVVIRELFFKSPFISFNDLPYLLFAAPLFLAIPLGLWKVRLAFWPRSTLGERSALILLSIVVALDVMALNVLMARAMGGWNVLLAVSAAPFLLGVCLTLFLAFREMPAEWAVSALLSAVYLGGAASSLLPSFLFFRDFGWYYTAAAGALLVPELILYTILAIAKPGQYRT